MPAPTKAKKPAEEKAPPADEPEEHEAPTPKTPKGKEPETDVSKTEKAPPVPELPKLRAREWFDHILPDKKGSGFLGLFPREIPEKPKAP